MQRAKNLDRLRAEALFDVLIVGGGATGLGAAVEAAVRGYRVALVERHDFAQGTSSRSTKLVHGGVRYLKQGNVSLVREALRERGRLLRNAPHLVRNLAFVIPNYTWWDGPFYRIGLGLYDAMAGKLSLGSSRLIGAAETLALLPTAEPRGLVGGVVYHDGQFDDARLAINLAQTAEEHGAVVVNYCACVGFIKAGGRIVGALLRDGEGGAEFEVRAKVVINATGVFVDELRAADEPGVRPIVSVSQGIHLVLPKAFMPGASAMMIPKTKDGRVLFAVPWHDRVVVGTTDTPMPAAATEPRALSQEVEFVLEHACKYLSKDPGAADVLSVFAGQRPLVRSGHAKSTAKLSRDHTILVSESGLVTITGGKWTTYRKMAEDVLDHAERSAGFAHRPGGTEELRLHGWSSPADDDPDLAVYGTDAAGVRELIRHDPGLAERLHPSLPYRKAELVWHARQEMARTVEDVLARRTRALLLDARASIEAAPGVAELLARELGCDGEWRDRQVEAYADLARGYVLTG